MQIHKTQQELLIQFIEIKKILNTKEAIVDRFTALEWCDLIENNNWDPDAIAIAICNAIPNWQKLFEWLGRWRREGILEKIKQSLLSLAHLNSQIDWTSASVDSSFSPWEGRRGGS